MFSGNRPKRPLKECGVSLSWLLEFASDISTNYSTDDVVVKVILPFSADGQTRYVDKVRDEDVGKPTYFVSHAWSEPFHNLVDQLKRHFACTDPHNAPRGVYLWVDIFAITQHNTGRYQADRLTWPEGLAACETTLLCVDREGAVLQRLWCLYEVWRSYTTKGPQALTILGYHMDVRAVEQAFNFFTVDKAKTSTAYDKEVIVKEVVANVGKDTLVAQVRDAWIQSAVHDLAYWQGCKASRPSLAAGELVRLAKALFICEAYDYSLEAARAAVAVCENVQYKVGLRNWTGINANRILGICLTQLGDYEGAETYLRRSLINAEVGGWVGARRAGSHRWPQTVAGRHRWPQTVVSRHRCPQVNTPHPPSRPPLPLPTPKKKRAEAVRL